MPLITGLYTIILTSDGVVTPQRPLATGREINEPVFVRPAGDEGIQKWVVKRVQVVKRVHNDDESMNMYTIQHPLDLPPPGTRGWRLDSMGYENPKPRELVKLMNEPLTEWIITQVEGKPEAYTIKKSTKLIGANYYVSELEGNLVLETIPVTPNRPPPNVVYKPQTYKCRCKKENNDSDPIEYDFCKDHSCCANPRMIPIWRGPFATVS